MLFTPGESIQLESKMFSYDHWSQQANADNTRQTRLAVGNEARGDGGSPRIRG